jgi:hypothetical protein
MGAGTAAGCNNRYTGNIYVTGVVGTTALGVTSETGTSNVYVTGVVGTGIIANVLVWSLIPTYQNPNWIRIAA